MSGGNDKGCLVYDGPIDFNLARKSAEIVSIGLNLQAADMTVDNSNIDPAGSMIEAELINDQGIWTAPRSMQQATVGRTAHFRISKRSRHGRGLRVDLPNDKRRRSSKIAFDPSATRSLTRDPASSVGQAKSDSPARTRRPACAVSVTSSRPLRVRFAAHLRLRFSEVSIRQPPNRARPG